MPDWEALDQLKQRWTDKMVRIGAKLPQYDRFEGKLARVITVNYNSAAILDFGNRARVDLPLEYLEEVPAEELEALRKAEEEAQQKEAAEKAAKAKNKPTPAKTGTKKSSDAVTAKKARSSKNTGKKPDTGKDKTGKDKS